MPESHPAPRTLGNQYTEDPALRDYLAWKLPAAMRASIAPALHDLGAYCVGRSCGGEQ
jgi:hypothetical protein